MKRISPFPLQLFFLLATLIGVVSLASCHESSSSRAPALDTSFLDLDAPGTLNDSTGFETNANVHYLNASELFAFNALTNTLTILKPEKPYAVGDVLINTTEPAFAVVVKSVDSKSASYSVERSKLDAIVRHGKIDFRFTPHLHEAASQALQARVGGDDGENAIDTGASISTDGTIELGAITLLDIQVDAGGLIKRGTSKVMGLPLASLPPGVIQKASTGGAAGGSIKAGITSGHLRMVPTCTFRARWDNGRPDSITMRFDTLVEYSVTVEMEASGAVSLHVAHDLIPEIPVPIPIPGVKADLIMKMPAGFVLECNVNGKATMTYGSKYTLKVEMEWNPRDGYKLQPPSFNKVSDRQAVSMSAEGKMSGKLYLEPRVMLKLYGVIGPYLYLEPYIRADLQYPWPANTDDLFLGIGGGCGLELDFFLFGSHDFRSPNLFEFYKSWDLIGPKEGQELNHAPVAIGSSVKVPSMGSLVELLGTDQDNDDLVFRIESKPKKGRLGILDKSKGLVQYKPFSGYGGSDSFSFSVHDGHSESTHATVTVTVQEGNPPKAQFSYTSKDNVVYVDARGSSDQETASSKLEVRWDWENDGKFDTGWSTIKTAQHQYASARTQTIGLQVRDHDGMTTKLTRDCDIEGTVLRRPNAPAGVSASAGDKQVAVSWNGVSNATSYNLYYSTRSPVTKSTGTRVSGVSTPHIVKNLVNDQVYYFVVTAVNSQGESTESKEVSAKPKAGGPTTGALKVCVLDIRSNAVPGAKVVLYSGDWKTTVGERTAGSDGCVTFAGLVPNTYNYEVYVVNQPPGLPRFSELWGDRRVSVAAGSNADTFTRFQPYSLSVAVKNLTTSKDVSEGGTVPLGNTIRITVTVKNGASASRRVKSRIYLDRSKSASYDYSGETATDSISAGSSKTFVQDVKLSEAGAYYLALATLTEVNGRFTTTDSWAWSQVPLFRVLAGSLSVTVVDLKSKPVAGAKVVLYSNDWKTNYGQRTTDSRGRTTFTNLAPETYRYEAYVDHKPSGLPKFTEFWGDRQVIVPAGPKSDTLTRFQPYASSVSLRDITAGKNLSWGATVPLGNAIQVVVTVQNGASDSRKVKSRLFLDRGRSAPYDYEGTTGSQQISGKSSSTFSRGLKPTRAGSYYLALETLTEANGSFTTTDSWGWSGPLFKIQASSLSVKVQNVGSPAGVANASVVLYKSGKVVSTRTTGGTGWVTFSGLEAGKYHYEAYVTNATTGLPRFSEFWGDRTVTLSSGANSDTFTRFQPYSYNLVFRDSKNNVIPGNGTVAKGEKITVQVVVKNGASASRTVRVRMIMDLNKRASYIYDSTSASGSVAARGSRTFTLSKQFTYSGAGPIYAVPVCETYVNGRYIVTDSWGWGSKPVFTQK